ncbi:MAG: cation:proton antiporter [Cyanobacteria bacterium P01_F01_bin.33]
MTDITIAWIALPLFAGFNIYLFAKLGRYLALLGALGSVAYAVTLLVQPEPIALQFLDSFGVQLVADALSGYFILTNALVTIAVILYCWDSDKSAFFFAQTIILHGSVNAVFICADLISLYVALEVIGIAAFLLIAYPRSDRAIWVALRYLFVSNTAMVFYLIGVVLVYQANQSFGFAGLVNAPAEAIALIFLGLLTKGGVFVSGLWLPMTHSEADTPVSALLSGTVVKTGVFPLVRFALEFETLQPLLALFGVGTALLGVGFAIFERDTKRTLALSTISQLGFVLVAPTTAGVYALTHGLAKATLFLSAGNLPSRRFEELRQTKMPMMLWSAVAIAGLSISGLPLLGGFGAKALTLDRIVPWQANVLTVAAVGTAIVFAKFLFLPTSADADGKPLSRGYGWAVLPLLAGLIAVNGLSLEAYTVAKVAKALVTVGGGWVAYWLFCRQRSLRVPQRLERLEHLIGGMSLVLTLVFWMVLT